MEMLDDDSLLLLFKLLNLNDRASLRLVNKRFKALCDTIPIDKLIVFERSSPETGKLVYTGEEYGYEDTARCFDLQKLFSSQQPLLNQMRRLRVLAINGARIPATQFDLNLKFDELDYLMLNQVLLNGPKILQSSQIQHLILDQVYMKSVDVLNEQMQRLSISGPSFAGETISVHLFGFDNLRSKRLKYLRLMPTRPLEFDFFDFCVGSKLFDSLDELELTIDDFNSLLLPSEYCANIKVISAVTAGYGEFFELIRTTDLDDFFSRIRKDLKIYLFGLEFNKRTADEVMEFLKSFTGGNVRVNCSKLEFKINKSVYETIKRFEQNHDLNRFYRLVSEVFFSDLIEDAQFYRKFEWCETIRFDLDDEPDDRIVNYLGYFPKVKCVRLGIHGLREVRLSDAFLDEIPKRCPRLFNFTLDCKNGDAKFDFLFQFEHLASVVLDTAFEFDQSVYIKLIKKMKCLFRLDVRYVSASAVDKKQLRLFKKRVLECLMKKSSNLDFKIDINKKEKQGVWFVRYNLKPVELNCPVDDEEKLYAWSKFVQIKATYPYMSIIRAQ